MRRLPTLSLLALVACSGPCITSIPDPDDTTSPWDDTEIDTVEVCSAVANLELVPLDVWGQDLLGVEIGLNYDPPLVEDPGAGPGVEMYPLGDDPFELKVELTAVDHSDSTFTIAYAGTGSAGAFTVSEPTGRGRVVTSWQRRDIDGSECAVFTVYAGLDHRWFSGRAPAPSLNDAELFIAHDEFWEAVANDLGGSRDRVSWSTWYWQSDFELLRPEGTHINMSDAAREANTVMSRFEALSGVDRRVLVNRFWDENSDYNEYLNTDSALRAYAQSSGDDFEVVLQGNDTEVPVEGEWEGEASDFDFAERVVANPRYSERALIEAGGIQPQPFDLELQVASWHQKFMVFDGSVAYVTGMNTKGIDWDTTEHLVFEPRRMYLDSDNDERQEVADGLRLPDYIPRRDYAIRVEGPAAWDVDALFHSRWEQGMVDGDLYADRATPFALGAPPAEVPAASGGVPTQLSVTMPEPWSEQSLYETHAKAFSQASDYILLEDQYFRAPMMNDLIVARMLAVPDLVLIVVTYNVSTWDGGAMYTYLSDATFLDQFPDRYLLLELKTAALTTEEGYLWDDVYFYLQDINTHSKLRLVDDRYLSVGSCNMNNRGYKYEGEMNLSVLDSAMATDARRTILEQWVGPDYAHRLSDDMDENLDLLREVAASNAAIAAWWEDNADDLDADEAEARWASYQPSGFVYPLEISGDYEWDVGPDLF